MPRPAVRSAASFITFSKAALVNPLQSSASSCQFTFAESGLPCDWTLRISTRSSSVGISRHTCWANWSTTNGCNTSGRSVQASSTTPVAWACSCATADAKAAAVISPSCGAIGGHTTSISSISTTQGPFCAACWITHCIAVAVKGPEKSAGATCNNGTPASPATAVASNVFPVPEGPETRQVCKGTAGQAPRASRRYCTTPRNSALAPVRPPTPLNVTSGV
mmetsp:Transcript_45190/g.76110  ORF Transcript_45190/g.76110 Transcript_45190/m.76110 type:complete len:221 (-) Transcript_45190:579-1241(-)